MVVPQPLVVAEGVPVNVKSGSFKVMTSLMLNWALMAKRNEIEAVDEVTAGSITRWLWVINVLATAVDAIIGVAETSNVFASVTADVRVARWAL